MRGRRTTLAEKKLKGRRPGKDSGDRPLPIEPEYAPELPKPPSFLKLQGLTEWKRLGPTMVKLGVLTAADWSTFGQYCRAVQVQFAIIKQLDSLKVGCPEWLDLDRAFDRNEKRLTKACVELGMTPVTRQKVALSPKTEDPLAEFKRAPLREIRGGRNGPA